MSFSDALEVEVLNWILGRVAMTLNTTPIYVGLSTTTPTDAGATFTEPVGNGYARVSVTNDATQWPTASGSPSSKTHANDIIFPVVTGGLWGTVTYFGIFTALSGGTPIMTGALVFPKTPAIGDRLEFLAGTLTVTLD